MRLLTKSRFKLALECPNKLYYTRKKEYANQRLDDPFLLALAEGGFQVEELARMQFPGGHLLEGHDADYEYLANSTNELLKNENVIIYEAAFLFEDLFVRTDLLIKKGNRVELIEVKSKSYDPLDDYLFVGKRGKLVSSWKPYLFDIAFQKYVMQKCWPDWDIDASLMMANKRKNATIDGLNQLFRISRKANNRTGVEKVETDVSKLGDSVLGKVEINDVIEKIINDEYKYHENLGFVEAIELFSKHYKEDKFFNWPTQFAACKTCEFRATPEEEKEGLRSGFKECFQKLHKWQPIDFLKPNTFNIWNFRKGSKLFDEGIIFKEDLTTENIGYEELHGKLSPTERQWLQIEKERNNDTASYVDEEGLKEAMDSWVYPLNLIDFETSTVALPFTKGCHPYEQVAFQFSHHIYYENGLVEHANEYINDNPGEFPNFHFIRKLKKALGQNNGSVFRFATHENTILNAIYEQLRDSEECDKDELMAFIQTITHNKSDSVEKWHGARDMIDLCMVVKHFYYNPLTKGSNSIKAVLPAVLNTSDFLKKKYARPIGAIQVTSKNFDANHVWLTIKNNEVVNPYKMLPPVFDEWTEEQFENSVSEIEELANGGAALTAYGKIQYTNMSDEERKLIAKALLKYCELDTLAMVMIVEHFKNDLLGC